MWVYHRDPYLFFWHSSLPIGIYIVHVHISNLKNNFLDTFFSLDTPQPKIPVTTRMIFSISRIRDPKPKPTHLLGGKYPGIQIFSIWANSNNSNRPELRLTMGGFPLLNHYFWGDLLLRSLLRQVGQFPTPNEAKVPSLKGRIPMAQ